MDCCQLSTSTWQGLAGASSSAGMILSAAPGQGCAARSLEERRALQHCSAVNNKTQIVPKCKIDRYNMNCDMEYQSIRFMYVFMAYTCFRWCIAKLLEDPWYKTSPTTGCDNAILLELKSVNEHFKWFTFFLIIMTYQNKKLLCYFNINYNNSRWLKPLLRRNR